MLVSQGEAHAFHLASLGQEKLSNFSSGDQGSGAARLGVRLLIQFAHQLSSDGPTKSKLKTLLAKQDLGDHFATALKEAGISRALLMASLPKGVAQILFSVGSESSAQRTCEDLCRLSMDLENSWEGHGEAQPLLSLLGEHLAKLSSDETLSGVNRRVRNHLGLYQNRGPLGAQIAFGARQLVYDKRSVVGLAGMALGMTAFNAVRMGSVMRGAGLLRANAQAFAAEGLSFTAGEIGAEHAFSLQGQRSLGDRVSHAYGMMGVMRVFGAGMGVLTQPLRPFVKHSALLNFGVKSVAPRFAEFGGLAGSGMLLEGQDMPSALRGAAKGVIHFAGLRGAMHSFAPRLASLNHGLQMATQRHLYTQGLAWIKIQRQNLGPPRGNSLSRRYGLLGPAGVLDNITRQNATVKNAKTQNIAFMIGSGQGSGANRSGHQVKGKTSQNTELDYLVSRDSGGDSPFRLRVSTVSPISRGEGIYDMEVRVQAMSGGPSITLRLTSKQYQELLGSNGNKTELYLEVRPVETLGTKLVPSSPPKFSPRPIGPGAMRRPGGVRSVGLKRGAEKPGRAPATLASPGFSPPCQNGLAAGVAAMPGRFTLIKNRQQFVALAGEEAAQIDPDFTYQVTEVLQTAEGFRIVTQQGPTFMTESSIYPSPVKVGDLLFAIPKPTEQVFVESAPPQPTPRPPRRGIDFIDNTQQPAKGSFLLIKPEQLVNENRPYGAAERFSGKFVEVMHHPEKAGFVLVLLESAPDALVWPRRRIKFEIAVPQEKFEQLTPNPGDPLLVVSAEPYSPPSELAN